MDWVDGKTLDRFLDDQVKNTAVLESLAEDWVKMMGALEERDMAHGDLQHANILVCQEPAGLALKLVDYDGMYVPSFRGEEGNESGLRDYQHPRRTGRDFNDQMDNFAALVIYISLRALVHRPALWDQYHTGENLLLQRKDFDAPAASPLFAELRTLPDTQLVTLLDRLQAACLDENPCSLPSLPSLATGAPARRPPVAPRSPQPVAPPPPVTQTVVPAIPGAPPEPSPADMPVACPHCGVTNRAIARFCRGCGLALPYTVLPGNAPLPLVGVAATQMRICPWCGMENEVGNRWCVRCTALLD